jgi:hypothetical protein
MYLINVNIAHALFDGGELWENLNHFTHTFIHSSGLLFTLHPSFPLFAFASSSLRLSFLLVPLFIHPIHFMVFWSHSSEHSIDWAQPRNRKHMRDEVGIRWGSTIHGERPNYRINGAFPLVSSCVLSSKKEGCYFMFALYF